MRGLGGLLMSTVLIARHEIPDVKPRSSEMVESFLYDRLHCVGTLDVPFMQRTSPDLHRTNMRIPACLPVGYTFIISSIRLAVTDHGSYALDSLVRALQDSAIFELTFCDRIFLQAPVLLLYNYVEINPEIRRSVVFHYNLEDSSQRSMPVLRACESFRPLLRSMPRLGSEYELLLSMYGYLIRPTL
jgi:hypothetical protein